MSFDDDNLKIQRIPADKSSEFKELTPAKGSIFFDEATSRIVVGDGSTKGGVVHKLSIETTGSGNAVTLVEVSEHKISVTKDKTFSESTHLHDDRYYTEDEVDTLLDGKANTSHGNHVPTTQTANNKVFLRNDNTWQTVTPANIGAAASLHSHDDTYYTEGEVDTLLDTKANTSHGNHVPATQTASNKVFLRNDNTWQTVTPGNIGAATSSHSHTWASSTWANSSASATTAKPSVVVETGNGYRKWSNGIIDQWGSGMATADSTNSRIKTVSLPANFSSTNYSLIIQDESQNPTTSMIRNTIYSKELNQFKIIGDASLTTISWMAIGK